MISSNTKSEAHTDQISLDGLPHEGTPIAAQPLSDRRQNAPSLDQRSCEVCQLQGKIKEPISVTYDLMYQEKTSAGGSSRGLFSCEVASNSYRVANECESAKSLPSISSPKLRFGIIDVVEFCMTSAGDYPKCRGPAVCLSSQIERRWKVSVNTFEYLRQRKRSPSEFYISSSARRRILRNTMLMRDLSLPNIGKLHIHSEEPGAEFQRKENRMNALSQTEKASVDCRDERFKALMARISASDERFEERKKRKSPTSRYKHK